MKLKQVLLTSTAMLLLGAPIAPLFAQSADGTLTVAQAPAPGPLAGAIQTYLDAQAAVTAANDGGGDVAAAQAELDAAEQELASLCAAIGQDDIQACIAMFESGGTPRPGPENAPQQPNGEGAPTPEGAPQEAPAPQPEQPAPEAPAPEQPAPEAPQEPAPAPEPEQPAAEQPAPEQPAPEQPAAEQPAPAPQPEQPAEPEQPAAPEQPAEPAPQPESPDGQQPVPPALSEAVEAYEQAVAEYEEALQTNVNVDVAADAVLEAEDEFQSICNALGQTDVEACLAGFGIEIDFIEVNADAPSRQTPPPGGEQAPQPQPQPEPAPAPEGPAPEGPAQQMDDEVVLEDNVQGEIVPQGTDAGTIAPLLDSLKDAFGPNADPAAPQAPAPGANAPQPPAGGPRPMQPPMTDADAQPDVNIGDIPSIIAEQGQVRPGQPPAPGGQPAAPGDQPPAPGEQPAAPGEQPAPQPTPSEQPQQGELVGRVEEERPSNVDIITTIGLATIFAIGANQFIDTPDTPRIVYDDDRNYYVEDLPNGRTREVIVRADGTQIVTIRDRFGDVIRRSRILADGREILLVYVDPDTRRYDDQGRWIDPASELPPLQLNIPAREYVLDASTADQGRVADFLDEPPVETLQRYYTIDEVKRSSRLRDMVRRLEVGDLTFETGSANISQSEVDTLSAVAYAMLDLIEQNPAETFLIEGHTDAVGSDLNNLELSDRRAEAVAYALTRVYGIPAENLATQGYGERYLKVQTEAAERVNRRVTIRRITPLITPMTAPAG